MERKREVQCNTSTSVKEVQDESGSMEIYVITQKPGRRKKKKKKREEEKVMDLRNK